MPCYGAFRKAEAEIPDGVFVYPNPAKSVVSIVPVGEGVNKVVLRSIQGKVFLKADIVTTTDFDVSHLEKGIYIAEIVSASGQKSIKVILE